MIRRKSVPSSSVKPKAAGFFESAFGIASRDLAKIMEEALSRGGDYCDLYLQEIKGNWIVMEDGEVNRAYTVVRLGMGVRVLKGQQSGFAFCQVLDMPSMLEAARTAASLAAAGKQDPDARGVQVGVPRLKPGLNLYDCAQPWPQVEIKSRLDLLRSLGDKLIGSDPHLIKTTLQFHDSSSHIMLANSEGILRQDLRPRASLVASCVAEKNGKRESNYVDVTARTGLEFFSPAKVDELATQAVERTLRLFEAKPVKAGETPVVLAPGSAGILLHEAIGHGLEADFNRRRISTYAERLGDRVASEQVTIVDDGTIPASHGAINFDDEGADSRCTVLVEKGVLKQYLHDRLSAAWYKTAPTGSGRRQSYEFAPMPRMRATFMEPGPYAPEEVIASVKKGIYAEQLTNGQVNIGAGDFSFYVKSGWAIENGKLNHPIKDLNLIGNGPEALSRISMVANDLELAQGGFMCGKLGQTVPVSQGLPTTLVSSVNVGGTKS
jgi:TldD protein